MNDLSTRLRVGMERSGKKAVDLSRATGVSPAAISKWLDGKTEKIKYVDAIKAAECLSVSVDWLMTGKGDITEQQEDDETEGFVTIRKFLGSASCGIHGLPSFDNIPGIEKITIKDSWYKKYLSAYDPNDIFAVTASGDSMTPDIKDGDFVFVKKWKIGSHLAEGIYFVCLDGDYFIKRLQRVGGGNLLLISSNPRYKDIRINHDSQEELVIIGQEVLTLKAEVV